MRALSSFLVIGLVHLYFILYMSLIAQPSSSKLPVGSRQGRIKAVAQQNKADQISLELRLGA